MHPLLRTLHDAAAGRFASPDGSVDVLEPAPGPCDVVTAFTAHGVVASPLAPDELLDLLPSGDVFSLLLRAARRLAAREPLFAQVAPGNAASLRTFLAAGFVPLGAEVLFPQDRGA